MSSHHQMSMQGTFRLYSTFSMHLALSLLAPSIFFLFDLGIIQKLTQDLLGGDSSPCLMCETIDINSPLLPFTSFFQNRTIPVPPATIWFHFVGVSAAFAAFLFLRHRVRTSVRRHQESKISAATFALEVMNADPQWTDVDGSLSQYFQRWGDLNALSVVPDAPRLMALLHDRKDAVEHLLFTLLDDDSTSLPAPIDTLTTPMLLSHDDEEDEVDDRFDSNLRSKNIAAIVEEEEEERKRRATSEGGGQAAANDMKLQAFVADEELGFADSAVDDSISSSTNNNHNNTDSVNKSNPSPPLPPRRPHHHKVSWRQRLGWNRDHVFWRRRLRMLDEEVVQWLSTHSYRASGRVFVTFEEEAAKHKCMKDHEGGCLTRFFGHMPTYNRRHLRLRQPGDPSDIQWQNLSSGKFTQMILRIRSWVVGIAFIGANGFLTYVISDLADHTFLVSIAVSLLAATSNFLVRLMLQWLGQNERHHSHSGEIKSVFELVLFARLANWITQAVVSSQKMIAEIGDPHSDVPYLQICEGRTFRGTVHCGSKLVTGGPSPACAMKMNAQQLFDVGGLAQVLGVMMITKTATHMIQPLFAVALRKVRWILRHRIKFVIPPRDEITLSLRLSSTVELALLALLIAPLVPCAPLFAVAAIFVARWGDSFRISRPAAFLPPMDERAVVTGVSVLLIGLLLHMGIYSLFFTFFLSTSNPLAGWLMSPTCAHTWSELNASTWMLVFGFILPALVFGLYTTYIILFGWLLLPIACLTMRKSTASFAPSNGERASNIAGVMPYADPVSLLFTIMANPLHSSAAVHLHARWDETGKLGPLEHVVNAANVRFVDNANERLRSAFQNLSEKSTNYSTYATNARKSMQAFFSSSANSISGSFKGNFKSLSGNVTEWSRRAWLPLRNLAEKALGVLV